MESLSASLFHHLATLETTAVFMHHVRRTTGKFEASHVALMLTYLSAEPHHMSVHVTMDTLEMASFAHLKTTARTSQSYAIHTRTAFQHRTDGNVFAIKVSCEDFSN
jgi:hypothetical protein